jgi:hypothetical protein
MSALLISNQATAVAQEKKKKEKAKKTCLSWWIKNIPFIHQPKPILYCNALPFGLLDLNNSFSLFSSQNWWKSGTLETKRGGCTKASLLSWVEVSRWKLLLSKSL